MPALPTRDDRSAAALEPAPDTPDTAADPVGPSRLVALGSDTAPVCEDGVCVL
ncbi:hypothetical protein ACTMTI_24780 [Nonomuraea sp. H19]|uniref:hypothetical protein n=1 Tax=Nonomuraea sp. H19 TaxID=3452206 RepID=UPI003F8C1F10